MKEINLGTDPQSSVEFFTGVNPFLETSEDDSYEFQSHFDLKNKKSRCKNPTFCKSQSRTCCIRCKKAFCEKHSAKTCEHCFRSQGIGILTDQTEKSPLLNYSGTFKPISELKPPKKNGVNGVRPRCREKKCKSQTRVLCNGCSLAFCDEHATKTCENCYRSQEIGISSPGTFKPITELKPPKKNGVNGLRPMCREKKCKSQTRVLCIGCSLAFCDQHATKLCKSCFYNFNT